MIVTLEIEKKKREKLVCAECEAPITFGKCYLDVLSKCLGADKYYGVRWVFCEECFAAYDKEDNILLPCEQGEEFLDAKSHKSFLQERV